MIDDDRDEGQAAGRGTGTGEMLDATDEALLDELGTVLSTIDPVPPGLADRALFALELEALRAEMVELQQVETPALAARSSEAGEREVVRTSTITFACDDLTVMVSVSESPTGGLCLDGWVAPADKYRVDLYQPEHQINVESDDDGAFVLFDVPEGPSCLAMRRADGSGPTVCTPVIEL